MALDVTMPWCAWLKHYPKDFALETGHLKPEELGAYVRLRDQYFANNGALPDDDIVLARIARISDDKWPSVRAMLLTLFKIEDGVWIHPRLDETLSVSQESYEKHSANGKKGALARLKRGSSEALARPKQSEPESESDSSKEEGAVKAQKLAVYEQEFDQFWQVYPDKVARQKALAAFEQAREDGVSLDQLLAGVKRYVRTKPDKQSYCHPATWLNDKRWTDGDAGQAPPDINSAPPDDPNRRKIYDLLGADDYRAWIETAEVRDGEIIIEKTFQRDHVETHFGDQLSKISFKVTNGLDVPNFLMRQ